MNRLIHFSVKNRKITIILAVILMISGIISYFNIPRQENPDVTSPSALITTIWPGASAEEVEELITKKIEVESSLLEGIENIKSISSNNASIVVVTINYSVDKDEQWTSLDKLIGNLVSDLPDGAFIPVIDTESMVETSGMIIAIYGDSYDYEALSYFSSIIRNELLNINGIKKVNLDGDLQKRIRINVLLEELNKTSLSMEDLYNLLLIQNIEIPSGAVETDSGRVSVSIPGAFKSIQDIENLIIDISENFGIVRLRDIADIYMDYDSDAKKFEENGIPAVLVTAYFKDNQNIIATGDEVKARLNDIIASMPDDLYVTNVVFQPDDVAESVNRFIINLFQGVAFVIVVILIGMGYKNAAIVSTAMPFSILLTFTVMRYMQIDIHQISIAALIISLGILVDNSIVVSDAIQYRIDEGYGLTEASIMGAEESAAPVFSSTLTTVAAFAPLIALPGEAGEFARSLPLVVIISLTASYISAMLFVPALSSIFLSKSSVSKQKKNRLKALFSRSLNVGLKHGTTTLILTFVLFFISIGIGIYFLPIEIFPYADKDYIYIDVSGENKGDIASTEALMKEIGVILDEEIAVTSYTTAIGGYLPKFYLTVAPGADSEHSGQILVYIDENADIESLEMFAKYLKDRIDSRILGSKIEVNLPAITAPGSDIEIVLYGDNKENLYQYADDLFVKINSMESIDKIYSDIPRSVYQYEMAMDKDYASILGLNSYDIQRLVNIALNGVKASSITTKSNEFDIFLSSNIGSMADLENLMIKSSFTNNKILLKQVTTLALKSQIPIVYRYNRLPAVSLECTVQDGYNVQDSQKHIETIISSTIGGTGIRVDYRGEKETITKYLGGIAEAALYALAAIYIILLIQFKSSRQTLIILLTIPLSIIGSMAGLYIFRQPFSFTAGLGLASLIGIVVNNAILLLDHINTAIKEGDSVIESCISSLNRRFRPIMLSTITTIIGLLPLALSGSSFFTPMAVTLMSGLFVSTFFTMIVIPTMYNSIFNQQG
ncbi:MAG: efflux RND transporter permease subunit [Eubacteriales bacterium]|nr:efflux RND transporter permease subunit [Eubacteriales bacterium]